MNITLRDLRRGKYGREKSFLKEREHKDIKASELEGIIKNFVGEEPWVAIIAGGPKYSTLISFESGSYKYEDRKVGEE